MAVDMGVDKSKHRNDWQPIIGAIRSHQKEPERVSERGRHE